MRALIVCALGLLMGFAPPARAVWENTEWAEVFDPVTVARDVRTCPDGQGGMVVAMVDIDSPVLRIALSRVDHTGNEAWGDGGIYLPITLGSLWQDAPLDIAPDGTGGVYCVYREGWPSMQVVRVARVLADASVAWSVAAGDFEFTGGLPTFGAHVEATGDGEAIVAWTHDDYDAQANERLSALRITQAGTIDWTVDVNDKMNIFQDPMPSQWDMVSDNQGGVLLAWNVVPFLQPVERRAQRVAANGVTMWGANGHLVWTDFGSSTRITADGTGGAYVATNDGYGTARAQHLDALGNETWVAGGLQVMVLDTTPNPCPFSLCEDGAGGLVLVQGVEDLYAQRMDVFGTKLWGPNGMVQTMLSGWQTDPSVVHDGSGGTIVVYRDHHFSTPGDLSNQVLSGLRIDGSGNRTWGETVLWLSGPNDQFEPFSPQVVADGSGGGLVAWEEWNYAGTSNDVYALGVGSGGETPATPRLIYLWPDAGSVNDLLAVAVAGDYLESSQQLTLLHAGGGPSIPITDLVAVSPQLLLGSLDLSGAENGAHHLQVRVGGVPKATLDYAFGIGDPPSCDMESPVPNGGDTIAVQPGDSTRRAAIDSNGDVHVVWAEASPSAGDLIYVHGDGNGWGAVQAFEFPGSSVLDPCITVDDDDLLHVAFVTETGPVQVLRYMRFTADLSIFEQWSLDDGQGKASPAIAVDDISHAHIVYEQGTPGATALFHVVHDGVDFSTPQDLLAGGNARQPDLVRYGANGLMLSFVRDFFFPGIDEVCYQRYTGSWDVATGIYVGVTVHSPSVAWDGADRLLFAWILDNLGNAPVLHTALMENDVLGPVRGRLGEPQIERTAVAGGGAGQFFLLTQEHDGGLPVKMNLREGDGNVFFPKRRLNASDDVDHPALAARVGEGAFAAWLDDEGSPPIFHSWRCGAAPVAVMDTTPRAPRRLRMTTFPNPFNPVTTIAFETPVEKHATLRIYDTMGHSVRTLIDGRLQAGGHQVQWDGKDDGAAPVASGLYFARLSLSGEHSEEARLVLIR